MASPLAKAIKQQHPNAWITWITTPECKHLIKQNPSIDKTLTCTPESWAKLTLSQSPNKTLQSIKSFTLELQEQRYEYALDLQGTLKSGTISSLSKAKHKIGLGSKEGSNWLMTKTVSRNLGDTTQIGSEYRYLANQLGLSDQEWDMQPSTPENEREAAKATLAKHNLKPNEKYLVICPYSSTPQKRWPTKHWQQACLRIRGRHHLKTVILGNANSTKLAEKLAKQGGAINLTNKCSTAQAAIIISEAQLLIGVDNGLTHLGHAYKTPTLALFGPSSPYSHTGLESSKIIHLDLNCSPCANHPTCNKRYTCMTEITPDTVLSQIKSLLRNNKVRTDT